MEAPPDQGRLHASKRGGVTSESREGSARGGGVTGGLGSLPGGGAAGAAVWRRRRSFPGAGGQGLLKEGTASQALGTRTPQPGKKGRRRAGRTLQAL